jgi:hypothetical protein
MTGRCVRTIIGTLCLIVLVGLGASSASADPYTFLDLTKCCDLAGTGTPFQAAEIASAVNDDGDVVGTAAGTCGV